MTRVFITGSTDGPRRAAAQTLIGDGHEVVVHARSTHRVAALCDLLGELARLTATPLTPQEPKENPCVEQ